MQNKKYANEITKNMLSVYRKYFVEQLNQKYPNLDIKKFKKYYDNQLTEFDKGIDNMLEEISMCISSKLKNNGKFVIDSMSANTENSASLNREFESIFSDYIGMSPVQVLPKNSKIKINGNNCMSEIKLIIGDGNEFSKKIENKENEFQK